MDADHNRELNPLDQMIEDALRTLPVVEPPQELLHEIMVQIQPRPVVLKPVFRIGWMDFALSLFFAGMIGMTMLLTYQLPAEIRMQLIQQMRIFELLHFDWVLLAAAGMSGLACISAAVVFFNSQVNRSTR